IRIVVGKMYQLVNSSQGRSYQTQFFWLPRTGSPAPLMIGYSYEKGAYLSRGFLDQLALEPTADDTSTTTYSSAHIGGVGSDPARTTARRQQRDENAIRRQDPRRLARQSRLVVGPGRRHL